jgi:hypothetical protein
MKCRVFIVIIIRVTKWIIIVVIIIIIIVRWVIIPASGIERPNAIVVVVDTMTGVVWQGKSLLDAHHAVIRIILVIVVDDIVHEWIFADAGMTANGMTAAAVLRGILPRPRQGQTATAQSEATADGGVGVIVVICIGSRAASSTQSRSSAIITAVVAAAARGGDCHGGSAYHHPSSIVVVVLFYVGSHHR